MIGYMDAATVRNKVASKAAFFAAITGLVLVLGNQKVSATEPGSFTNLLFGATMGAPIGAAPPPGLFFNNSFFYFPMAHGAGNAGCGAGCTTRYNGAVDAATLTWSTGLTFLGGVYFPTISTVGYGVAATTTPYPPGGGVGASPIFNNALNLVVGNTYVNPINFSWKIGNVPLFVNAGLGFVAPIGTTYAGSPMPDYWTIRPHVAISYLGDGWNLTANMTYDINTASTGNTGTYQTVALKPGTSAFLSSFLTGPANPGRGYTSGNLFYLDLTSTKKFGSWEVGPVGYVQYQTTSDSPGGVNPATGSAWTCSQLTAAALPSCGRSVNIGAGLLVGYNFGPVDMKLMYVTGLYAQDAVRPTSEIILKTSFRLWEPDAAPSKKPYYTKN